MPPDGFLRVTSNHIPRKYMYDELIKDDGFNAAEFRNIKGMS